MPTRDLRREFAVEVVSRLRQAGFQALWAGGCVRDLLLELDPADYDVATDALPERVMALFRRTVPVGVSFGVVRVLGPPGAGEVEVATFRSDGRYLDGRRPESVVFSTPEADASRRDFTINGMFFDPLNGQVIDHVGGRADLERRTLRAIGAPEERFAEDKLRLLRAVRFAARFDLEIEPKTRAALVSMAGQVVTVAAERIAHELRRMLVHAARTRAMELAFDVGLVAAVLPPLVPLKDVIPGNPVQSAESLWDHTMGVLEHLPAEPTFPLAFAALVHEVGKPSTWSVQDGQITFPDYENVGRRIASQICIDLKLSNAERDRITWLVESQQALVRARELRESKLKRILASPGIEELLALHRASALAADGDLSHVDYCDWYLREQPTGPICPPPLLTGHDLQRHGLKPGPRFKEILEMVRDAQLERVVSSKHDALEWLDRELAKSDEPSSEIKPL